LTVRLRTRSGHRRLTSPLRTAPEGG